MCVMAGGTHSARKIVHLRNNALLCALFAALTSDCRLCYFKYYVIVFLNVFYLVPYFKTYICN